MVVNGRPLKRMKRRVTADLHDFLTFPSIDGSGSGPTEPFRVSVRTFLSHHALLPPPSSLFPHLLTWQIQFRVGDFTDGTELSPVTVCLDVVEEDVARSRSVYCDQCRVVGWSGNPVCSKRYHFIVKADGNSIGGCKSCNHVTTTDDVEDWVYHQLEDTTHLLHGVVHANGYGHLLRVNGREGGSRVLSGCHIMDFWDRLCKALGVRVYLCELLFTCMQGCGVFNVIAKVSVMDVSKKYGMEYRLLHAITRGHPWYGDWGYEFGAGSFALTRDAYKSAVEALSTIPLSIFLSQGRKPLFTKHKVDEAACKKPRQCVSEVVQSWTKGEIERVDEAMFRVLRAVSGSNWVSWRTLRGAVCKVAKSELLDHCLKELGGKLAADGMVVVARCNPDSGAFEYRLEQANDSFNGITSRIDSSIIKRPSQEILMRDLKFFFESLLHPQTMVNYGPEAMRDLAISSADKLLDCKQFMKDYYPEVISSIKEVSEICLSCELEVMDLSEENALDPPSELIVLPVNATVCDLKVEAARAFQEVYLVFRRFQAEELLGYSGVDDSTQVKLLLGSSESVCVRGRCLGKNGLGKYRMERGIERWTVDCICGAKDDDGERMLACDVCGVWQHTRCSGIHDSDAVPARFVCYRCRDTDQMIKISNGQCKDEKTCMNSDGNFGKSMATPDVH
ncbi:hypothetical protein Pint_27565 [Pistacia integerrima]|uniref:Uncharacterized protein n=1 Tax=Pistacia integerrima TaxID=434235 RepID=A0ACC0YSC0_9ROSI|nr:hypothetical protein Pint_27565 [Pistacia integerrima]